MKTNIATARNRLEDWGKSAPALACVLGSILLLQLASPAMPDSGPLGWLRYGIEEGRGRNPLWWLDLRQANNGYYEALMSDSSNPGVKSRSLLSRLWIPAGEAPPIYDYHPFRMYTGAPNVRSHDPREGPVFTNSRGLFDREHTPGRNPNVRRVAVLGDSLTRGWGVAPEDVYLRVAERALNGESKTRPFEFINFSVTGYRATQLFDVALEAVPEYKPDVYLFVVSELAVSPDWGAHLYSVVQAGKPLKYGFLDAAVKQSGVTAADSPVEAQRKFASFRAPVLREILTRLKAHAARESAELIAVLVTAAEDPELVRKRFRPTQRLLDESGVTVVNLLDTFDNVKDIESMRKQWYDAHPNAEAHRRLARNLIAKSKAKPEAWRKLTAGNK